MTYGRRKARLSTCSSSAMDEKFSSFLSSSGILISTLNVLIQEQISSETIFKSLRSQHFDILLPKMSVGQHALLLTLWNTERDDDDVIDIISYLSRVLL